MSSLAATIPPELFQNILYFVGYRHYLYRTIDSFDETEWQEELHHLSACAATCAYWAHLTRPRIFDHVVFRSYKDFCRFQPLLHIRSSSHRIEPISNILFDITLFYTLGDHPWFHTVGWLKAQTVPKLARLWLHISGPPTPAFTAASTRQSILHPLSFSVPRTLPMGIFSEIQVFLYIENIHLPNPAVLFNLLQDCLLLRSRSIHFTNVTWDNATNQEDTLTLPEWKFVPPPGPYGTWGVMSVYTSECMDAVLLEAIVHSAPHHAFSQRQERLHLEISQTSRLLDIMRISWSDDQPPSQLGETTAGLLLQVSSILIGEEINQNHVAAGILPPTGTGTGISLRWHVSPFNFRCMARRSPDDTTGVCSITCVIIHVPMGFRVPNDTRESNIDWNTFFHTIRQLPDLRKILIMQTPGRRRRSISHRRYKLLSEFVAYLEGACTELGELLEVYRGCRGWFDGGREIRWTRVELEVALEGTRKTRDAQAAIEATSSDNTIPPGWYSTEIDSGSRSISRSTSFQSAQL